MDIGGAEATESTSVAEPRGGQLPSLPSILVANLTWVIGILVGLLVLVKVAAVSHYDMTTALTILSISSLTAILVGTVLLFLPNLLILSLTGLVFTDADDPGQMRLARILLVPLTVLNLLVNWSVLTFLTIVAVWLGLVVWLPRLLHFRLERRLGELEHRIAFIERTNELKRKAAALSPDPEIARKQANEIKSEAQKLQYAAWVLRVQDWVRQIAKMLSSAIALGYAIVLIMTAASARPVWLPPELVSRDTMKVVGYVLSDADNRLLLLREPDRAIVALTGGNWGRKQCRMKSPYLPAPIMLKWQSLPKYLDCEEFMERKPN